MISRISDARFNIKFTFGDLLVGFLLTPRDVQGDPIAIHAVSNGGSQSASRSAMRGRKQERPPTGRVPLSGGPLFQDEIRDSTLGVLDNTEPANIGANISRFSLPPSIRFQEDRGSPEEVQRSFSHADPPTGHDSLNHDQLEDQQAEQLVAKRSLSGRTSTTSSAERSSSGGTALERTSAHFDGGGADEDVEELPPAITDDVFDLSQTDHKGDHAARGTKPVDILRDYEAVSFVEDHIRFADLANGRRCSLVVQLVFPRKGLWRRKSAPITADLVEQGEEVAVGEEKEPLLKKSPAKVAVSTTRAGAVDPALRSAPAPEQYELRTFQNANCCQRVLLRSKRWSCAHCRAGCCTNCGFIDCQLVCCFFCHGCAVLPFCTPFWPFPCCIPTDLPPASEVLQKRKEFSRSGFKVIDVNERKKPCRTCFFRSRFWSYVMSEIPKNQYELPVPYENSWKAYVGRTDFAMEVLKWFGNKIGGRGRTSTTGPSDEVVQTVVVGPPVRAASSTSQRSVVAEEAAQIARVLSAVPTSSPEDDHDEQQQRATSHINPLPPTLRSADPIEVLYMDYTNKISPCWQVLLDHRSRSFIINIRGSNSARDWSIDLMTARKPLPAVPGRSSSSSRGGGGGKKKNGASGVPTLATGDYVHHGNLMGAKHILSEMERVGLLEHVDVERGFFDFVKWDLMERRRERRRERGIPEELPPTYHDQSGHDTSGEVLQEYDEEEYRPNGYFAPLSARHYRTLVTGHSLGAGTAIVLALLMKRGGGRLAAAVARTRSSPSDDAAGGLLAGGRASSSSSSSSGGIGEGGKSSSGTKMIRSASSSSAKAPAKPSTLRLRVVAKSFTLARTLLAARRTKKNSHDQKNSKKGAPAFRRTTMDKSTASKAASSGTIAKTFPFYRDLKVLLLAPMGIATSPKLARFSRSFTISVQAVEDLVPRVSTVAILKVQDRIARHMLNQRHRSKCFLVCRACCVSHSRLLKEEVFAPVLNNAPVKELFAYDPTLVDVGHLPAPERQRQMVAGRVIELCPVMEAGRIRSLGNRTRLSFSHDLQLQLFNACDGHIMMTIFSVR